MATRQLAVVFVRHGERLDEADRVAWSRMATPGNWHNPPLTDTGRLQGRGAGAELRAFLERNGMSHKHVSFFASPSSRTLTTAAEVGAEIGGPPVHIVHGLYQCCAAARERGLGALKLDCPKRALSNYPIAAKHGNALDDYDNSLLQVARLTPPGGIAVVVTHREGIRITAARAKIPGKVKMPYCASHVFHCHVRTPTDAAGGPLLHNWQHKECLFPVGEDGTPVGMMPSGPPPPKRVARKSAPAL
eukprot:TRINITY_DN12996_c2_g2_i1.p1 TRINITY_DN12996_c2_g2~~TRINITY_DN12996_c2_g2_i1.p1  ORF type:complete len:256 (+),score=62.30 TRINITY_DN12996_c2_g2_i1:32-769(+)